MATVNNLIEDEMTRAIEQMKNLKPGDDQYNKAADAIATLQKARMEEEKLEFEDRKNGDELALKQMEQEQAEANAKIEKRKFTIRTCLDAAAIVLPMGVYAFFGVKGFKFEQTGSYCSNTNRWNLANIFKFRK